MKNVLITGGTGSFGRAFARHLLDRTTGTDKKVIIYSRGEHAQEEMSRSLSGHSDFRRLRFFIGDVRDLHRLELALRGVDTVVHAAALKIVPTAEYNPTECVSTNIDGAGNVVLASIRNGVRRVIALSTDKAVHPVNLYGATKLAAEKIFIAANNLAGGDTVFNVVRYGNVAGSRGSVIPLFAKLKKEHKRLPITDEHMTRFCITMTEAIYLVVNASQDPAGRKIYVPKIPSMSIMDLASAIDPGGDIDLIGIRPGEKVHECLLTEDESRYAYEGYDCYVINYGNPLGHGWKAVRPGFSYRSDKNPDWMDQDQIRKLVEALGYA